jgi:hypothetical protein
MSRLALSAKSQSISGRGYNRSDSRSRMISRSQDPIPSGRVRAVKYSPKCLQRPSNSRRVLPDPEVLHRNLVVQGVRGAIPNQD